MLLTSVTRKLGIESLKPSVPLFCQLLPAMKLSTRCDKSFIFPATEKKNIPVNESNDENVRRRCLQTIRPHRKCHSS